MGIKPIISVSINAISSEYRTLQDIVYDKLKEDILTGKLEPNTPLNTSELSRKMEISRTPIREAINKLASIGLVSKINHREARVASFMSQEIHELFYVRAALEGIAARNAATEMPMSDKKRLLQLAEECAVYADCDNREAFLENNRVFHHLIYACVKTPLIQELIEQFYIITKAYRSIGFELKKQNKTVAQEHAMLAQYIWEGDADNADECGRRHHINTIKIIDENYGAQK